MKKWIVIFLAMAVAGLIFWSCSDDDKTTEPTNKAPTCSITSPADNATFTLGNNITVSVDADDPDGTIAEVRFYFDGNGIGSDTSFPYSFSFPTNSYTDGTHTVKVIAEDYEGAETAKQLNINISPPPGMVFVQGGTFTMGDHFSEGEPNELPVHSVTLSNYCMGAAEVTQSEWAQYMPAENWSSFGTGDTYPVYNVSWYSIIKYCNLRSIAEGLTPCYTISSSTDPSVWGTVPTSSNSTWDAAICNWSANGYRLPTEAEWEYASRGGINNADNLRFSGCHEETDLTNYAWYGGNYTGTSHPVGTKLPNQLGVYDMSGNLWELCWDWYGSYTSYSVTNPYGPTTGSYRVLRGGYWLLNAIECRLAYRNNYDPHEGYYNIGFRLSRTP
jgi:formylglycine-generating enzyme